jgi:ribosome recycling factor
MPLKATIKTGRDQMKRSVEYYEKELRGIRTGRASTALVDYVKIDYYGTATDLKDLAAISVPEPTMLVIKPFDPGSKNTILKAIETAELGLNPQADGDAIRISVPPPSRERRMQLVAQVRKLGEDTKIAIRNERRDALKLIDKIVKDKDNSISEDAGKGAHTDVDDITKKHIARVEELCEKKASEVSEL